MKATNDLAPSVYEATVCRPCYPEAAGNMDTDVCIVGGGFAGLHTALSLQEAGRKVTLMEARRIGCGASGRNGGHFIPELAVDMEYVESQTGIDNARFLWGVIRESAQLIKWRMRTYHIDAEFQPGHLIAAIQPGHWRALQQHCQYMNDQYSAGYELIESEDLSGHVRSPLYRGAMLNCEAGHLHPLRLALGLARAVQDNGGQIYEQSPLMNWQREGDKYQLHVGVSGQSVACVNARTLVLACNNGITDIKHPQARTNAKRILPVGTWVIASEPLPDAMVEQTLPRRAAVCDNRFVMDYYRLTRDNRLVLGGGCSYMGHSTPQGFQESMRQEMVRVFPGLRDTQVEYAWGGTIDISMDRAPDVGALDEGRLFFAQGFSGSGIVATALAGRAIAMAITGDDHLLNRLSRFPKKNFPGGNWWRGPIISTAVAWERFRDQYLSA